MILIRRFFITKIDLQTTLIKASFFHQACINNKLERKLIHHQWWCTPQCQRRPWRLMPDLTMTNAIFRREMRSNRRCRPAEKATCAALSGLYRGRPTVKWSKLTISSAKLSSKERRCSTPSTKLRDYAQRPSMMLINSSSWAPMTYRWSRMNGLVSVMILLRSIRIWKNCRTIRRQGWLGSIRKKKSR